MSVVETNTQAAEQSSSIEHAKSRALQELAAIVFFGAVGVAMLGWVGLLIWIALALCGF
jgi:hypothetical protein